MRKISLDNGNTFLGFDEAMAELPNCNFGVGTILHYADDDLLKEVNDNGFYDTQEELLEAYLKVAEEDIIVA